MKDIHTKIEQPLFFRKVILNAALNSVETLKSLEQLSTTTLQEKTTVTNKLTTTLQEFDKQLDVFKKGIPPLPKEFIDKQEKIIQQRPLKKLKQQQIQRPKLPQHLTFDQEIASLKQRLNSMQV